MLRKFFLLGSAALAAFSLVSLSAEEDAIETFMKKYHKAPQGTDPVCKKACNGAASAAEVAELLAGYETIAALTPPKGEEASWKEKTGAVITSLKDLQASKENAAADLKKAMNCKGCHSVHKP